MLSKSINLVLSTEARVENIIDFGVTMIFFVFFEMVTLSYESEVTDSQL